MPPLIDSVSIIESLPRGDNHTGEALAQTLKAQGHEAVYTHAETEAQFLTAIQDAERRARSLGEKVALHFEVHGSDRGFQLADDSYVSWFTVKRDIQKLNFALKNHLLVSMAVCRGLWLMFIIQATDASPFHSLVACEHDLPVRGIERGFPVFYEALFNGNPIETALQHLNLAQNGLHPDYRHISSEQMFIRAYRKYFRDAATPENLRPRANAVFNHLVGIGVFQEQQREHVLSLYLTTLKDSEEHFFEKFREKFFMHDAYPDNMTQFCPTFEEVRAPSPEPPNNH